jgi:hypothetical protein
VTIERVKTGDVYGDELFLITPTGKVGPMGPAGLKSGLLHQLQATILSYRDRIRVGNAHWESTVGDGAISCPGRASSPAPPRQTATYGRNGQKTFPHGWSCRRACWPPS